MLTLNGIRAVPNQTFRTVIEQGLIQFQLYFRPAIQMWMIDISFKGVFVVKGIRVCNYPNLLEQFTEIIPFGLMCSVGAEVGYEPSLIDDFSTQRVTLNVLNQEEIQQIEDIYVELRG